VNKIDKKRNSLKWWFAHKVSKVHCTIDSPRQTDHIYGVFRTRHQAVLFRAGLKAVTPRHQEGHRIRRYGSVPLAMRHRLCFVVYATCGLY